MTWLDLVPAVALAAVVLVAPGSILALAAGLRPMTATGVGPVLSAGLIGSIALIAAPLGIDFGWIAVAVPTLLLAAVVAGIRRRQRAGRDSASPRHDPPRWGRPAVIAAAAGLTATAIGLTLRITAAWGRPDAVAQTYDSVFHYNAVRQIRFSGDASSLGLNTLVRPQDPDAFYPGAWHALVALVTPATSGVGGIDAVAATNAVALVVAVLVWPLGAVLLARSVLGPSTLVTGAAAVTAGLLAMFPLLPLSRGLMYPNLLGVALLPAALALVIAALRLAATRDVRPRTAWALSPLVLVGLGLAHPNTVIALVFTAIPACVAWVARRWRADDGAQRRSAAAAGVVLLLGLAVLLVVVPAVSATVASVQRYDLPARESAAGALISVVTGGAIDRPPALLATGLLLIGIVVCVRRAATRWFVGAWAVGVVLYVLAASQRSAWSTAVTGWWYNHDVRLAALVPVTAVVLVTAGLVWLATVVPRRLTSGRPAPARPVATVVVTILVVAVTVPAGQDASLRVGQWRIAARHVLADDWDSSKLVTADEVALLKRLERTVPAGTRVVGNPADGSALSWALGDRQAVFPAISGIWDPDRLVLGDRLRDAAGDPEVCAAARALDVEYALSMGRTLEDLPPGRDYPGLRDLADAPGFTLVDSEGDAELYRLPC